MARRTTKKPTFLEEMKKYAQEQMNEAQKIHVMKQSFLMEKKAEIQKAVEEGYPLRLIAEFATVELLKSGVPGTYKQESKEGEEREIGTKITPMELKKLLGIEKVGSRK